MSEPTTNDELDFTHYVEVLLRRRWIVIAAFSIVFISTAIITFTTRPV